MATRPPSGSAVQDEPAAGSQQPVTRRDAGRPRPRWKAVALPAEHGGWGLTLEAAALGLLVRPSMAGAAIGLAGLLAFLARTPLKLALVDRRRRRRLERSVLAERLAALELVALAALLVAAGWSGKGTFWEPLAAAAPLFALELAYDARSRGRRLVPELAGSIGMAALAASIALAGGERGTVAVGLWVLLAARALSSIPYARAQVRRLHHQPDGRRLAQALQPVAIAGAAGGLWLGWVSWLAVAALGGLASWQLLELHRPVRSARRVGLLQLAGGFAVVVAAALGAHR